MKWVYIQTRTASNGRYLYDLLDLNGGFAGSNEFYYPTLGEAYEAGVDHVQEFPESFTLATPAAVATLLKDAYYHMVTLRSFANAGFVMGDISGLNQAISETEKMLFV